MIIVVIAYLAVVILIGVYMRRRIHTQSDYLNAGGQLGPIVGGCTIAASQMSAGTAVGTAGFHYLGGYSFAWVWLAIWAGYLVTTFIMAPKMRALYETHGSLTVPDMLDTRYRSTPLRVLSVVILIGAFGLTIVAELVGGAYVLGVVFGMPNTLAVIIIAGVFITYTLLGGLFAIAYTDVMQVVVFVVGFAIAVPFVVNATGGFSELNNRLAEIDPTLVTSGMGYSTMAGAAVAFFVMILGYPLIAIRFYSIRDNQSTRRAVGLALIIQAVAGVSVAFIGVSARVLYPDLSTPDLATITIATEVLPSLLGGLLLAAIIAAIQSTISAVLLMLSSALSHDLLVKVFRKDFSEAQQVRMSRIFVLLLGIIPIPIALYPLPLIQQMWINAAVLIGSAFAVPSLAGLVWRRATGAGALASMIGGILVAIVWLFSGNPLGIEPAFVSIPTSLILMVLVSLATPPSAPEAIAPFFSKRSEVQMSARPERSL